MSLTESELWMSRRTASFVDAGREAFASHGRGVLVYLEHEIAAALRSNDGHALGPDAYLKNDADLDALCVPESVREWIRTYDPEREVLVAVRYGDSRVRAFRCTAREFPKRRAARSKTDA